MTPEFRDGVTVGLVRAMLRVSRAGLHAVECPEPERSCTCGIDAAIQRPPAGLPPVALDGFRLSPWGRVNWGSVVDGEPDE